MECDREPGVPAGPNAHGCERGVEVRPLHGGGAEAPSENDTLSGKQILQKGGLCSEDREVDDPDPDSDEYLIWRLYELALGEDTEEAFQSFRKLFPEQRNTRELREMRGALYEAKVELAAAEAEWEQQKKGVSISMEIAPTARLLAARARHYAADQSHKLLVLLTARLVPTK